MASSRNALTFSWKAFKFVAGFVAKSPLVDSERAGSRFVPIELFGVFQAFGAKLFAKPKMYR